MLKLSGHWKSQTFSIFLSLASILFWVLGAAPAVMSPDSLESWRQLKVWDFWDGHPVVFTIWLWVTSFFGQSLFLAAIIQEILLFGTIYFVLKKILADRSWPLVLMLTSLLNFTPFFGQMGVTIWKDVPYVAFTLIGIVLYFSGISVTKNRLFGLLSFSFGALMRHDGILFAFMYFCILLFFYRQIYHKSSLKVFQLGKELVVSLILIFCASTFVPQILNASPVTQSQSTYPLVHDIAFVESLYPGKLPANVREQIKLIVTDDSLQGAKKCGRVEDMILSPGYNNEYIDQHPGLIPRLWLESIKSSALEKMLRVHFCRAKAFLPGVYPQTYVWTYFAIDQNLLGLKPFNSTSTFYAFAAKWSYKWSEVGRAIAHPGTWALASLFCFLWFRKRNFIILIAILGAGIVKNLQNIVYTTGPYYRYGYLTQISGIIGVIFFIEHLGKSKQQKTKS